MVSVLQNTRGSTLGRERAHYSENKSVRSKNLKNFPANSREAVSVSTICDQYCSRDDSIVPTSCPWASEDVLSELIRTAVVICLNPLTPKSDQYLFSLNNFNTFLRETVQRIYKIITKEEMLLFFIEFSSPSGSLKNYIELSHYGPFSVALSFFQFKSLLT